MHPEKLLIKEKELAAMLSVSWRHVQNLRKMRLIPHVRLGRVVRYRVQDVEKALERLTIRAIT